MRKNTVSLALVLGKKLFITLRPIYFLLCCLALFTVVNTGKLLAFQADIPGYVLRINVPTRMLELYFNGGLIKSYSVGVGHNQTYMTPQGKYIIDLKVIDPIWENPYKPPGASQIASSKNSPLGKYWIGFHSKNNGAYGIHGTNEPASIGKFVSHGCVRMHNKDIEELFQLIPVGTPLAITYERYKLYRQEQKLMLRVFPDPYHLGGVEPAIIMQKILNFSMNHKLELLQDQIAQAASYAGMQEKDYEVARFSSVQVAPLTTLPQHNRTLRTVSEENNSLQIEQKNRIKPSPPGTNIHNDYRIYATRQPQEVLVEQDDWF